MSMSRAKVFTFEEETRRDAYGTTLVHERFSTPGDHSVSTQAKQKNLLLTFMQLALIFLYLVAGVLYMWRMRLADSLLGIFVIANSLIFFMVELICPPFVEHYFRFWFELSLWRLYVFFIFSILVMDASHIVGYICLAIVMSMAVICFFFQIRLPPPLFSSSEMMLHHTFVLNPEYESADLFNNATVPVSIQQSSNGKGYDSSSYQQAGK